MGISTYQYDMTEAEGCHAEISTDPKGNETKKVYDRAGRLIKVISNAKETIFTYYGNGSRKSIEYPEGAKEEYTYYKDNLVKTLVNQKADGTIIDSYSYKYDAAHNQIEKQDKKGMTNYDYDSLNRLEKVTEPDGKITEYIFDMAGNRIQETITQGAETIATTYEYNEQNRLTNTITRNGAVTETTKYEYDPNGNTMTKTVETTKPVDPNLTGSFAFNKAGQSTEKTITYYEYDQWNQLIKTIEGDKTIIADYNGNGQRVEKTINGITKRYLYEYDKVVLETDGQGNETARNIYGTNLLVREAENETAYYMYNGHGDVTALIGTDGTIAAQYYYDAFGNPVAEGTNENGVNNPIRYAGYQWDGETEIYYLNARYYDPKIARFLTEDTYRGRISDPLSLNLYTYCHNEPVMYIDPTGHWEQGDSKRKAAEQAQILEATKEYISAKEKGDKAGMDKAHQKAEDARAGKVYKADNITSSSIEKALKEISDSKYVYKSAKDDVKKSTMTSVVRDVSDKNPYKAQIERGQAQTISAINSERKSSNILDPAKAPKGTIGLGSSIAKPSAVNGTVNGNINYASKGPDTYTEKDGVKTPASNLPGKGEPNSTGKLYNPDGTVKQERKYGPDGKAQEDTDYNHEGDDHEFPHKHQWDWSKNPPRQNWEPIPQIDTSELVDNAGKAAGWATAGTVIYWIISEGTRLFPPRNLVPIP